MRAAAAALLAGLAALVLIAPPAGWARLAVLASRRPATAAGERRRHRTEPAGPRNRRLAGAALGLLAWWVVGGPVGLVAGIVAGLAADAVLSRLEPRSVRRRREQVAAEIAVAVDLLGACLRSGCAPAVALTQVAAAVGGPLGTDLAGVAGRLRLGAAPDAAWAGLTGDPVVGPLARAMVRSADRGVPLADLLDRAARETRAARRAAADERARRVGVLAAAPLGLCFLPAFLLLGVVPVVIGAVTGLLP